MSEKHITTRKKWIFSRKILLLSSGSVWRWHPWPCKNRFFLTIPGRNSARISTPTGRTLWSFLLLGLLKREFWYLVLKFPLQYSSIEISILILIFDFPLQIQPYCIPIDAEFHAYSKNVCIYIITLNIWWVTLQKPSISCQFRLFHNLDK